MFFKIHHKKYFFNENEYGNLGAPGKFCTAFLFFRLILMLEICKRKRFHNYFLSTPLSELISMPIGINVLSVFRESSGSIRPFPILGDPMPPCPLSNTASREPAAFLSSVLLIWFTGVFSSWTLIHTAATFGHVSWATTKTVAIVILALSTLLSAPVAKCFWKTYALGIERNNSKLVFSPISAVGIVALAACLFILPNYILRFCLVALVFIFFFLRQTKRENLEPWRVLPRASSPRMELGLFLALLAAAFLFTTFTYRSDYDDAEYLQIAIQTISYPERAPLTFDSSLGVIVDLFRFQPYRLTSYENFAAFISDISSIHLMTVYYILLPAVGSILCMSGAYLLIRWFLSGRMALVGLFIFLLVLMAWGETSIAYGSRVLMRLYQGKGWLIAVSSPFVVLCGLMLMRERKTAVWLCYVAGNITAVGLSSSGLVVACGMTLLLAPLAFTKSLKKSVVNLVILGTGAAYPMLCGLILAAKFPGTGTLISEYFPIDASLGLNGRECLTLALFAFSANLWGTGRQRELVLLTGGILFLIMNPWGSEIIADHSANNMRWRLAWAAPIPAILAILLATFWDIRQSRAFFPCTTKLPLFIGCCLTAFFLCMAPWICRPGNGDFHFSFPTWRLPPEYAEIKQLAELLPDAANGASVLVPFRQGAWLPVIRPKLRVILPGHGYPLVLPRILSPQDFQERIEIQGTVENPHLPMLPTDRLYHLLSKLNVEYIITPKGKRSDEIIQIVNKSGMFQAHVIGSTSHFDALRITKE